MKRYLPLLIMVLFTASLSVSGMTLEKKREAVRAHTRTQLVKKGLSEETALKAVNRLAQEAKTFREELRSLKRLCRMSADTLEKMTKNMKTGSPQEKPSAAWTVRDRKREAQRESTEKRKEFRSPRWSDGTETGNSR